MKNVIFVFAWFLAASLPCLSFTTRAAGKGMEQGNVLSTPARATETYLIEMLGRQGTLVFPVPTADKPTSATLSIPVNNVNTQFQITGGSWDGNGVFTGQIMKGSVPAALPGISYNILKLKKTTGTYQLIGAICQSATATSWYGATVVLGYSNKTATVKSTAPPLFTLVVNDKHAPNNAGNYSYGWYMEPTVATSANFRMVHLVRDDVLKEVALYAFENDNDRTLAEVPAYKKAAYKIKEIMDLLGTMFSSGLFESRIAGDLAALLINEVQLRYPSSRLGFKSTGHGSPEGIMNGFFEEDYSIKRSLGWVKETRGGNINFLDFATNCNVASLFNLSTVAGYVDYVLACDMTRTSAPIPFALWSQRPDEGGNYSGYFKDESKTVRDILSAMVDKYGALFNSQEAKDYAKTPEGASKLSKQQMTLFDMAQFPPILNNIGGDKANETCNTLIAQKSAQLANLYYNDLNVQYLDFKAAIPVLFPQYTNFSQDWSKFAISQMSNRGQYAWETDLPKGMTVAKKFN